MMRKNSISRILLGAAAGCLLLGSTAFADDEKFTSNETYRDSNGNICVDFGEVQVYLPSDWSGLCQMAPDENSVSFYQTKSRRLITQELGFAAGGWLFTLHYSDEPDYVDYPSYDVIGGSNEGYYFVSYPTDVQAYVEDSAVLNEYSKMSGEVSWIVENIQTPYPDIVVWDDMYSSEEHILPQSSDTYLTLADIEHMDAQTLQMAINEIYARHHRKFVLEEVQEYFDSCSWYDGYIEAADFNTNVMNEYEGKNISILVERMNAVKANPGLIVNRSAAERPVANSAGTTDCYGMIIESGEGYFQVRQSDGTAIQFWYDSSDLGDMGLSTADLSIGATVSVIYTLSDYEAVDILVY